MLPEFILYSNTQVKPEFVSIHCTDQHPTLSESVVPPLYEMEIMSVRNLRTANKTEQSVQGW